VVAANADIKHLAQRAFATYLRSVFLEKNKEVFNVHALPTDDFARSLGLVNIPQITFGKSRRVDKNQCKLQQIGEEVKRRARMDVDEEKEEKEEEKQKKKKGGRPTSAAEEQKRKLIAAKANQIDKEDGDDEGEDTLLKLKREKPVHETMEHQKIDLATALLPKRKRAWKFTGKRVVFGEDDDQEETFAERAKKEIEAADADDKATQQQRLQAKRKKKLDKANALKRQQSGNDDAGGAVLLNPVESEEEEEDEDEDEESKEEEPEEEEEEEEEDLKAKAPKRRKQEEEEEEEEEESPTTATEATSQTELVEQLALKILEKKKQL
jgi:ATP-dependent RNA helicase DDX10/DBP4